MLTMKYQYLTLALLTASTSFTFQARPQELSANIIRVELKNEKEVVIQYEIKGDPDTEYEVALHLLRDDDPDFEIELGAVRGDIGRGRFAGSIRRAIWDMNSDYPKAMIGQSYRFKLVVSPASQHEGLPWWIYAGSSAAICVAIIALSHGPEPPPPLPASGDNGIPRPPSRP
jgi:hypothetical protein